MPARDQVRDAVLRLAESSAVRTVLDLAVRLDRGAPGRFVALTYHRIDDGTTDDVPPGLTSATPADFERQVELVVRHMQPVGLADVLAARRGGRPLPRRAVLLTFDDAYRDFGTTAWPVLRRHGVPVTQFVATGFPGTPRRFWWDRVWRAVRDAAPGTELSVAGAAVVVDGDGSRADVYRTIRRHVKGRPHDAAMAFVDEVVERLGDRVDDGAASPVLDWDELRRLAADGVTLAPHSRTHAMLDQLPRDRILEEVAGSLLDLRREIGDAEPVFAYPSGQHDDVSVEVARDAGIELAFTTRRGGAGLATGDPLRLPRVNVGRRTSPAVLQAQLLPTVARASARWLPG